MAIKFDSLEDVEVWLNSLSDDSRQQAFTELATRIALRVTPKLQGLRGNSDFPAWVLSHFRCLATPWAASRFPTRRGTLQSSFRAASLNAESVDHDVWAYLPVVSDHASAETQSEAVAAVDAFASGRFAVSTWQTGSNTRRLSSLSVLFTSETIRDAELIEESSDKTCINQKLWNVSAPPAFNNDRLPAKEDWDVWSDWYEAVSLGNMPWPEAAAVEIVTLPEEDWKRGPAFVNKKIKEILVLHRLEVIADELPEPFALAPQFGIGGQGEIVLEAAHPSSADPANTHDLQVVYGEVRSKLQDFLSLGDNALGELRTEAIKLCDRLHERMDEANIYLLWSSTSALRIKLKLHEDELAKPYEDRNLAVTIEATSAAHLSSLVAQLNIFMFLDEKGRELDRISLGPEERNREIEELRKVAPAIVNISNVANGAAVHVIAGNLNSAINAPQNIHGSQAVDQGTKTTSNFLVKILTRVRSLITWASKEAASALVGASALVLWGVYGSALVAYVKTWAVQIGQFMNSVFQNPAIQKIIDQVTSLAA